MIQKDPKNVAKTKPFWSSQTVKKVGFPRVFAQNGTPKAPQKRSQNMQKKHESKMGPELHPKLYQNEPQVSRNEQKTMFKSRQRKRYTEKTIRNPY